MKCAAFIPILFCIFHSINAQGVIDTALLGQQLKEFTGKLDRATAGKDSILLERSVSRGFIRIHGTNGGLEERSSWINGLLKGSQSSQEVEEVVFEKTMKYPSATAAIEQSVVRRRTVKDGREIWLRSSSVYAKVRSEWMLAQMQATLMHDGPTHLVEPHELNEYTGTYEVKSAVSKNFKITTLENQALYCPVPEGYRLLFFKMDKDNFLSQGGVYTIIFERDSSNKVKRLGYYRNNKSFIQGNLVEQANRQ